MESGIDPGQDYYTQDYYNYDHGYDLPQYGSRRKLISPSGLYDEYGEVVVNDDGSYYYSPQESDAEHACRKHRIKLVVDREYETSSTGEDSTPETQRNRLSTAPNSHANVNGSVYMSQNGSIVRTRRSVNAAGPAHTTATNNNLKLTSPIFSSRLAKHFKKLDKMAATLEERVPLSSSRSAGAADRRCHTMRTFQSPGSATCAAASSLSNVDDVKTLNVLNTRQSSASLGSTSTSNTGPESVASKSNAAKGQAPGSAEQRPHGTAERAEVSRGERETRVDGGNESGDNGLATVETPECPSDRTQSDEEELWMGPWNSLHIPMTKL